VSALRGDVRSGILLLVYSFSESDPCRKIGLEFLGSNPGRGTMWPHMRQNLSLKATAVPHSEQYSTSVAKLGVWLLVRVTFDDEGRRILVTFGVESGRTVTETIEALSLRGEDNCRWTSSC